MCMLCGQDIYQRKNKHTAPVYVCTVTDERLALDFCLKHRSEGYYYESIRICEDISEVETLVKERII